MTLHCFYRFLFVVSFVGSVIFSPQMSTAYQLTATTTVQETIAGRILSINQTTGTIMVETATGIINLEAAPEAITDWKEGDPIVIKIDAPEQRVHEEVAEGETTLPQSSSSAKSEKVGSH